MKNILLVDDNRYILDALSLSLGDIMGGYAILTANNGREALDILDRKPVALVMTDIEMPVMNGIQFIENKNRLHPSIPVIAMTSDLSPAVAGRLGALGVNNCLEKPFDFEEVTRLVTESLTPRAFFIPGREIPAPHANA